MQDPSLQRAVLRLLEQWNSLPLSDIARMLGPLEHPRFRDELIDSMEAEGLVRLRLAGDEQVVQLTSVGKDKLAGRHPTIGPSGSEV
jgi:hypothetical protein